MNDEQRNNLLLYFKTGAYAVVALMGAWILFVTIFYIVGIGVAVENWKEGNLIAVVTQLIIMVIAGIMFYGIPALLIRNCGLSEVHAIEENEVSIADAVLVKCVRSHHGKKVRVARYRVAVQLLDETGSLTDQILECKGANGIQNCPIGDYVTVVSIHLKERNEILCIRKQMI